MNEILAVFVVAFLIALRFGLPLALILGGGYLINNWVEHQVQPEKIVK